MPEFRWTLDQIGTWGLPLTFILVGALFGLLIERVFLRRLREWSKLSKSRWDDVIVDALRHAPILWFGAAGAYAALEMLPLSPNVSRLLNQTLVILVLISVTVVVARMLGDLVQHYAHRMHSTLPAASLASNIVKLVVLVGGTLLILQNIGVSVTPLVTGLGIGGLAVALALQPTLANLFAGFQVVASGQVRRGDYLRLDSGEEGYVIDVKWRNTTIKSLWEDHEVIVPNSRLGDSIIINYNLPSRRLWARVKVGVHYDSDLRHVERVALAVLREMGEEVPGATLDEEPFVRFTGFGESSVDLTLGVQVNEFADRPRIQHECIKRVHARFAKEGIIIPFPIRTLHVPDAFPIRNASRLPEDRE
jgi:small-conductance mechanosensitive channel